MISWSGVVTGIKYAGASTKAVDEINANPNILPNHTLEFVWKDSGCNYTKGIDAVIDLYNQNVTMVLGIILAKILSILQVKLDE